MDWVRPGAHITDEDVRLSQEIELHLRDLHTFLDNALAVLRGQKEGVMPSNDVMLANMGRYELLVAQFHELAVRNAPRETQLRAEELLRTVRTLHNEMKGTHG